MKNKKEIVMQINRDTKVLHDYDILLVDAYGVFRDGNGVIPGSNITFKNLMDAGKTVLVLSNTTQKSDKAVKGYAKKGIEKGVHCNDIITSGEIAYNMIQNEEIKFNKILNPKKVYYFGTPRKELFENSIYEESSIEDADFMYISIPQLKENEASNVSDEVKKELYVSNLFEETVYDSLIIDPFLPMLEEAKSYGLPAFNANPDTTALEGPKPGTVKGVEIGEEKPNYVVRQGMIAEAYEKMGMEVIQAGKPYLDAYKYCIEVLKRDYGYTDETLKSAKIGMIGDNLHTDILGARTASEKLGVKIDGILTLTGVASKGISDEIKFLEKNEEQLIVELQKEFDKQGIEPQIVIEKFPTNI